jgi:hypothetical protein
MERTLSTYEAKCRACGSTFAHPSLGDLTYGEMLFCSQNGRSYVAANGLSSFAQRVRHVLGDSQSKDFWRILAALTIQADGVPYTIEIRCPVCCAAELEYWDGDELGMVAVPDATFPDELLINEQALSTKISALSQAA